MKNTITKLFALAALAGTVLAGCSSLKEEGGNASKDVIRFTASIGTYQVKATDTAFEEGDAIGLFADYPVNVQNLPMTWSNGTLAPETPVYWGADQFVDQSAGFYAYYPYNAALTERYIELFSVQEDQTTHDGYTASDLMIAGTMASPAEGTVNLNFIHRMTKLVLHVENRLTDAAVTAITVGNVYLGVSGRLDSSDGLRYAGDPGSVKAGKVVLESGEVVWQAIIAPGQYVKPAIIITMEDGKEFVYNADDDVYFSPSRCYNATVIIDETSVSTDFTSNITDWLDGSWFWFSQNVASPYDGEWSLIGTIYDTMWDTDFQMENWGDNIWYTRLTYYEGQEFKFRMNWDWTMNLGGITAADGGWQTVLQEGDNALSQDGPNLMLPATGYYDILLSPADQIVSVTYVGEIEPAVIELDQIQPIVDAENDTEVEVTQVVYAQSSRGFVLFDGKYSIFVYTGSNSLIPELGDIVKVKGKKIIYNNVPEITTPTYEVVGSAANEMMDIVGMCWDVTNDLDNEFASIAMPISVEGVMSSNGYDLVVEDHVYNVSLYYPAPYFDFASLANHKLKVYGFYNGRRDSSSLVYLIPIGFEDYGEVEPVTPPVDSPFVSNVTWELGERAYVDNTLNVTYGDYTFSDVPNVKLGTSSMAGNMKLNLPAGTTGLSFWAIGWKGKDGVMVFTIGNDTYNVTAAANTGAANSSPYNVTVQDTDHYSLSFPAALTEDTVVNIETTSAGYRAFIFGVVASN